jgi:hypothetical protein
MCFSHGNLNRKDDPSHDVKGCGGGISPNVPPAFVVVDGPGAGRRADWLSKLLSYIDRSPGRT